MALGWWCAGPWIASSTSLLASWCRWAGLHAVDGQRRMAPWPARSVRIPCGRPTPSTGRCTSASEAGNDRMMIVWTGEGCHPRGGTRSETLWIENGGGEGVACACPGLGECGVSVYGDIVISPPSSSTSRVSTRAVWCSSGRGVARGCILCRSF